MHKLNWQIISIKKLPFPALCKQINYVLTITNNYNAKESKVNDRKLSHLITFVSEKWFNNNVIFYWLAFNLVYILPINKNRKKSLIACTNYVNFA